MNVKQITIAVSILASATGAMAVEATQWNPSAGPSSRAAIKAEVQRAIASGDLQSRGETYAGYLDTHTPAVATLTRAEVRLDLAQARANGELEARGEAYGGAVEPHRHDGGNVFAWVKSHTTGRHVN